MWELNLRRKLKTWQGDGVITVRLSLHQNRADCSISLFGSTRLNPWQPVQRTGTRQSTSSEYLLCQDYFKLIWIQQVFKWLKTPQLMIWGIKKTDFGFRYSKRNILLIQDFGRWLKSENKAVHVSRTATQNSLAQPRKNCWLQVCPKFYFSGRGGEGKI